MNLDSTIDLYEKMKNLKTEIKMLRIQFEKESLSLLMESTNSFQSFLKIKKLLKHSESLHDINYIKEDLNWFLANEEKLITLFRNKFHEVIKNMVK